MKHICLTVIALYYVYKMIYCVKCPLFRRMCNDCDYAYARALGKFTEHL